MGGVMVAEIPVFQIAPTTAIGAMGAVTPIDAREPVIYAGWSPAEAGRGVAAGLGVPPFVLARPSGCDPVIEVAKRRFAGRVSDTVIVTGEEFTGSRFLRAYLDYLRDFPTGDRISSLMDSACEVDFAGGADGCDLWDAHRYYTFYFSGDGRPVTVRFSNPLMPEGRAHPGVVAFRGAVSCGVQATDLGTLLEMIVGLNDRRERGAIVASVEEAVLSIEAGALILADRGGKNRSSEIPDAFFDALWNYLGAIRRGEKEAIVARKYLAFAQTLALLPHNLLGSVEGN